MYLSASLAYLVGGAPRAASSPGRTGPSLWHVSSLQLFNYHYLLFLRRFYTFLITPHGIPRCCPIFCSSRDEDSTCWHGSCARVRPCNADKPERLSCGSRPAPRTSPHQILSAFFFLRKDQRQDSKHGYVLSSPPWTNSQEPLELNYGHIRRPSLFHAIRLHVKGGLLSIASQELLLTLQPSPSGLDHGIATWHTSGG